MTKIRSIKEACSYIRSLAEDTRVIENAIRCLALSSQIPSVKIGRKYFINVSRCLNFSKAGSIKKTNERHLEEDKTADIRPIPERFRCRN